MIDRNKLRQAIENLGLIDRNNYKTPFMWNGFEHEAVDISAIYIDGKGPFKFPLNANGVIGSVFEYCPIETSGKICCEIDASRLALITTVKGSFKKKLQSMTYCILERMLGVSFKNMSFSVEPKLDKLIICQDGESYSASFSSFNVPGKFGTLILEIPLEGELSHGRVVIHNGMCEITANFGASCGSYLASAVAGCFSNDRKGCFAVHSDPGAKAAALIINLLWNDHLIFGKSDIMTPYCFPEFLILTNEIKTALKQWEIGEPTFTTLGNDDGDDDTGQPGFLCILPTTRYEGKVTFNDLNHDDLIVVRSLKSITFLDVHCASIRPARVLFCDENGSQIQGEAQISSLMCQFVKGNLSQHCIADNLFGSTIHNTKNILSNLPAYGNAQDLVYLVIVIRPRNLQYLTLPVSTSVPEVFVESIEGRFNYYSEKVVLDNPFVLNSLLGELKQLVDSLQAVAYAIACRACFLARLSGVCIRLKAQEMAEEVLTDVIRHQTATNVLICVCQHKTNRKASALAVFASFIAFTDGWVKHRDILAQLTEQMLTERSFATFFSISVLTLEFMKNGYLIGATETLKPLMEFLKYPNVVRSKFHVKLVSLAIRLQQDQPSHEMPDWLLSQMGFLHSTQLTKLIRYLGRLLRQERLDCRFFMKKLGHIIMEDSFNDITPEQYLEIVEVYRSIDEHELVEEYWKILCSRCIEISNSKDKSSPCLLCEVLREFKTTEARNEMVADLISTEGFKEALNLLLLQRVFLPEDFDTDNCEEYIESILLFKEPAQLPQATIVKHLSSIFHVLDPDILFPLSTSLFQSKFDLINQQSSTMRDIFASLLQRISSHRDNSIVLREDISDVLVTTAWFGNVQHVRSLVLRFQTRVAGTELAMPKVLSIMLSALTSTKAGLGAAFSLFFSREVFHYLLFECLKILEQVPQRISSILQCYGLMIDSERNFVNSTPPFITEEWVALIGTLNLLETLEMARAILNSEMSYKGPSLRNFPPIWTTIRELCYSALSKWTPTANLTGLSDAHLIALLQCFFWIGEQKGIADVCRLLNELQRSIKEFAGIHGKVVRAQQTFNLAINSVHAVLAFNELIDTGIHILSKELASLLPDQASQGQSSQKNNSSASQTSRRLLRRGESLNYLEPAQRSAQDVNKRTIGINLQKEIDELQEIRRQILTRTLVGQAADR